MNYETCIERYKNKDYYWKNGNPKASRVTAIGRYGTEDYMFFDRHMDRLYSFGKHFMHFSLMWR